MKQHSNIRRVILHVGRHKSGTSSLQAFLARNHRLLGQYGILYPNAGRPVKGIAHHDLAHSCAYRRFRPHREFSNIVKSLDKEVRGDHETLLISSEAFQKLESTMLVQKLVRKFPNAQIDVFCYFREFTDYMMSAFRQATQNQMRFRTFDAFLKHRYPLQKFIRDWQKVGSFKMKWFHPTTLKNGDIVEDFFEFAELEKLKGAETLKQKRNVSIGGNLLFFKLASNFAKEDIFSYRALADLAKANPDFQKPFFVFDERIIQAREKSDYNDILETYIGTPVFNSWQDYEPLPAFSRLTDDQDFIRSKMPDLDLSALLPYSVQAKDWF